MNNISDWEVVINSLNVEFYKNYLNYTDNNDRDREATVKLELKLIKR